VISSPRRGIDGTSQPPARARQPDQPHDLGDRPERCRACRGRRVVDGHFTELIEGFARVRTPVADLVRALLSARLSRALRAERTISRGQDREPGGVGRVAGEPAQTEGRGSRRSAARGVPPGDLALHRPRRRADDQGDAQALHNAKGQSTTPSSSLARKASSRIARGGKREEERRHRPQ
jgi:hypothetical protein